MTDPPDFKIFVLDYNLYRSTPRDHTRLYLYIHP